MEPLQPFDLPELPDGFAAEFAGRETYVSETRKIFSEVFPRGARPPAFTQTSEKDEKHREPHLINYFYY